MKLLMVSPDDNVAIALGNLSPGQVAAVQGGNQKLIIDGDVPQGHKVAMLSMEEGEEIVKAGIIIGVLCQGVKKGAHIHVHNLRSKYL